MPARILAILVSLLLLAAGSTGYLVWRNTPAQVAKRYLEKLARTVTVYRENSPVNRRFRASSLGELLADPLELHLPSARVDGSFNQEELQSGYLSVSLECGYFQVAFSKVKLLQSDPKFLRLEASLEVVSDFPDDLFPFRQLVELQISRSGKSLLLSSVSSKPEARAP